jgi:sterol desaturase/sphingolipid hydroxylase (fatty acid hydroxylase superfamily)
MIPLVVCALAAVMIATERVARARAWPRVAGWWTRALAFNALQFGVAWLAGSTWERWLSRYRPWSLDELGTAGGALVGYLAITLVYYGWHRLRHAQPFLWRWLHQLHHSPARIEILTSFYKHPLELLANSLLSAAILYFLVGVGPAAAAWAILLTGVAELFYHWNVRTPHWLGYLIQRPESHCVHHQLGLHGRNYGDLPLWDMLFGTFHNPRDWNGSCGFGEERERRVADLLLGREVA